MSRVEDRRVFAKRPAPPPHTVPADVDCKRTQTVSLAQTPYSLSFLGVDRLLIFHLRSSNLGLSVYYCLRPSSLRLSQPRR